MPRKLKNTDTFIWKIKFDDPNYPTYRSILKSNSCKILNHLAVGFQV